MRSMFGLAVTFAFLLGAIVVVAFICPLLGDSFSANIARPVSMVVGWSGAMLSLRYCLAVQGR